MTVMGGHDDEYEVVTAGDGHPSIRVRTPDEVIAYLRAEVARLTAELAERDEDVALRAEVVPLLGQTTVALREAKAKVARLLEAQAEMIFEIERLTTERDEWQARFRALRASMEAASDRLDRLATDD